MEERRLSICSEPRFEKNRNSHFAVRNNRKYCDPDFFCVFVSPGQENLIRSIKEIITRVNLLQNSKIS
jgi:hypothetical protein